MRTSINIAVVVAISIAHYSIMGYMGYGPTPEYENLMAWSFALMVALSLPVVMVEEMTSVPCQLIQRVRLQTSISASNSRANSRVGNLTKLIMCQLWQGMGQI